MATRIIASVTVSTPVASVSVQAQGAATVRLADGTFTSSVTRIVPVANIKWINIQLAAEVDFRGLNPVVKDFNVVLDDVGLHLFKTAFDNSASFEEHTFVLLRKTPDEPLTAVEQHGYHLDRGLVDLIDATDDFYGTSNIDDDQVMFLSKSLQPDSFGVSDTFEGWSFGKNSVDPAVTQDVINSFDTTKQLDDIHAATEQHGLHLDRSVSDVADAGDEVNALFQTDDGEVMFLAKSLPVERQTSSDTVEAVDFGKASVEAVATSETTVADVEKAASDQAVSGDTHVAATDKPLTDTGTSSEYAQFLVEKPLADAFGKDDADVISFGKARLDVSNATDQLQPFVLGKAATDSATTGQ